MISRPFLQILGYKPDYVVVVQDSDHGNDYNNNNSNMNVYYNHLNKSSYVARGGSMISTSSTTTNTTPITTSTTTTTIDSLLGLHLLTSGYSMPTILHLCAKNPTMEHIRTLAEGPGEPCGPKNQIGQRLTELSMRLACKGFFADPKYFPRAPRDMRCLASGMSLDELRLRKLFRL